jgi:hypothetical protein
MNSHLQAKSAYVELVVRPGLHSSAWGWRDMAGCCEYGNERSSSIIVELLIHLGEYELLCKDFCSAE